jgi:hypothetical protein
MRLNANSDVSGEYQCPSEEARAEFVSISKVNGDGVFDSGEFTGVSSGRIISDGYHIWQQ